ncbi:MAG: hypothetical protein AAF674_16930 [Pseudomonadota bacterium]
MAGSDIVGYGDSKALRPDGVMEYAPVSELTPDVQPETAQEAADQGRQKEAEFWRVQIETALKHERRWREEAANAEEMYFGPDRDPGRAGSTDSADTQHNRIDDKVALIHANIDVLKPLVYSSLPIPMVRRRFRGDGPADEVALRAAECGQRLAEYLIDTSRIHDALVCARDDWLIAGRGHARVRYSATVVEEPVVDEMGAPMVDDQGNPITRQRKVDEAVHADSVEWRRFLIASGHSWVNSPWIAYENTMTRASAERRFGKEVAQHIKFTRHGLGDADSTDDEAREAATLDEPTETGTQAHNPFDTAPVWEIWSRETGKVVWWCKDCPEILEEDDDILGLEEFWPGPKPLFSTRKGDSTVPRPDIKYYERRAREVEEASAKLKVILNAISVSGAYPGADEDTIRKLLNGKNEMVPVQNWIAFMEKGGSNNIIQWLPLNMMVAAIQALVTLREQAKAAMFEASGVSDIMRAQGDPNTTATAEQLKGRYAGLRVKDRQQMMGVFARDLLRIMIEIAVEHFDTSTLAEVTGIDLPMTEAELQMIHQQAAAQQAAYQYAMQQYQAQMAQVQQLQQAGVDVSGVRMPPPPTPPPDRKLPKASWEAVHAQLRSDFSRKITLSIETESTVLADEQADKEARVEFLAAFAQFVGQIAPVMASGLVPIRTVKELLLFGVRGFPKARLLESMIQDISEEEDASPQQQEDTQVQVAKIRAEVDRMLKEMDLKDKEREREHEMALETRKMGGNMISDAARMAASQAQGG